MKCWGNSSAPGFLIPGLIFLALGAPFAPVMAQAPAPLQPSPLSPPPLYAPAPNTGDEAISTGTLKEPDFSGAGLLDEFNGGFGPQTWRGADRALVERLIAQLPASTPSSALQQLTRRLLLSTAEPPEGAGGGGSFLALRTGRLIQAGQLEPAGQLAGLAGENPKDEQLRRARAEIVLAQGQQESACASATANVRSSNDVFWLKLTGICQALKGEGEAAQLSAELAAEQDPKDSGYQALMTAWLHKNNKLSGKAPRPDILQLAMIRAAGLPLPATPHQKASAAELLMMARMPGVAVEKRLPAAERAAIAGAIAPEELMQLYTEMPFPAGDRGKAHELALKMPGPAANALLFQAAQGQEAFARGPTLAAAWSLARANDSFAAVARANLISARELLPSPELLPIAADTGRAFLAAGDVNTASQWYALARAMQAQGANTDALRVMQILWPLLWLAQSQEVMADDPDVMIMAWLAQLPAGQKTRQGTLMLSAMAALGLAIPDSAWINLLAEKEDKDESEPIPLPSPVMLHLLSDAASSGRVGLTVLLSLTVMGERGVYLTEPLVLGPVLRALSLAGLQNEARALAVDAMLLAGM